MTILTNHSDQELLYLLKEGDHAAFTELYNRYWEKLLLIAWNHTKDTTVSEDMVHELFIALWHENSNDQIQNVGGFLATKLKFLIFKQYRKQQRRVQLLVDNFSYSIAVNEEEKLDALFLQEYINGIVEKLPEKCRLVFKLSREEGLKNSEIAEKMSISEKGVEANLTRALKIIRGNLESSGIVFIITMEIFNKFKI